MAKQLFNMSPEFTDFIGWYLKAYQAGTTIPLDIYPDSTLTNPVETIVINDRGFFESNGITITPRVGGRYDLFLFPTLEDANNDNTIKAKRLGQETAAEILLGDGGSIEKATQDITGIVKYKGLDNTGGSIILNISDSRDAVKAVFITLQATQTDVDNLSTETWIDPALAYPMIVASVTPDDDDWRLGETTYLDSTTATTDLRFVKGNETDINIADYPRITDINFLKNKKVLDLPAVNTNVEVMTRADVKPVTVIIDSVFYMFTLTGDSLHIHKSTDGLNYSFFKSARSVLTDNDNFHVVYDGGDLVMLVSGSTHAFYSVSGSMNNTFYTAPDELNNAYFSQPYSGLHNVAYLHANNRLKGFISFSDNVPKNAAFNLAVYNVSFDIATLTETIVEESIFEKSGSGTDMNTKGVCTNGNYGFGDISYDLKGFYYITSIKFSDVWIRKINERFLNDAFNVANDLKDITGAVDQPLLNGNDLGIDPLMSLKGCAVNNNTNLAVISHATDLETAILVRINEVFSYKVITNAFAVNNDSCIIPLGGEKYLLLGDNGDGIAFTNDSFETITTNVTDSTGTVGVVGKGCGYFANEANKYIIPMGSSISGKVNYIDITATKSSEYASPDLTSRDMGNTSYHIYIGLPE